MSLDELSEINILKQVDNIKNHPIYKVYGKDIDVSGFLFHLDSGKLEKII